MSGIFDEWLDKRPFRTRGRWAGTKYSSGQPSPEMIVESPITGLYCALTIDCEGGEFAVHVRKYINRLRSDELPNFYDVENRRIYFDLRTVLTSDTEIFGYLVNDGADIRWHVCYGLQEADITTDTLLQALLPLDYVVQMGKVKFTVSCTPTNAVRCVRDTLFERKEIYEFSFDHPVRAVWDGFMRMTIPFPMFLEAVVESTGSANYAKLLTELVEFGKGNNGG